jgi:hypothetical protein
MGYLSDFTLKVEKSNGKTKICDIANAMAELQKENANIFYLFTDIINQEVKYPVDFDCKAFEMFCHKAKWYERNLDMIELSKKFPNIIFKLECKGEEKDALWEEYYQNGKRAIYEAKVIFPEFNINDLK